MDPADLDLVAAGGATVVTNPVSNLKLAVGRIFDYPAARRRGIPTGLGTDGASSNNSLDLCSDLKVFSILQKHAANDTTAVPADEAWRVATGARAPFLGGTPLTVGAPADFILVRLDAPELGPGHLLANLVYAASGHVVDTTVVDGEILMRDGVVDGDDEIRAKARERRAARGALSGAVYSECGCPNTSRTRASKCSRGSVSYPGSNATWSHSSANCSANSNHG